MLEGLQEKGDYSSIARERLWQMGWEDNRTSWNGHCKQGEKSAAGKTAPEKKMLRKQIQKNVK